MYHPDCRVLKEVVEQPEQIVYIQNQKRQKPLPNNLSERKLIITEETINVTHHGPKVDFCRKKSKFVLFSREILRCKTFK